MAAPVYEIEREFNSSVIHSSSVQSLSSCGIQFEMRYMKHLPEEKSGSAALFGLVCHRALEWWAVDRTQSLLLLMEKAWAEMVEGTPLEGFLKDYARLSKDAIRLEHQIRQDWASKGKESKAPRMTKDFKESAVAGKISSLLARYAKAMHDSAWRFTDNDPLPGLYDESLVLSKRYERDNRHLPNVLKAEFKFMVEWRSFTLKGTVDSLELLRGPRGEASALLVTDYKSYRKEASEQKDYRQMVMYHLAAAAVRDDLGIDPLIPLYVGIDYIRLGTRTYWEMGEPDFVRLERELNVFRSMVDQKHFLPAQKSYNPDYCAYPSRCCMTSTAVAGGQANLVEVTR
ncbi:MAG: PD-(D/E)XK nuclease family protein [Actinobacteria bacterium]|nr:PD-(D/E)XK nuclease family protein [Actinomycetota bacterium]